MNPKLRQPYIQEMNVKETKINGLYVVVLKQVTEGRGTIREFFRTSSYETNRIIQMPRWAQINVTETNQGAIRGLHAEDMQKLVGVIYGEAFGAYVDIRDDSPSRGEVVTVRLIKGVQVLVPKGVCNGFQSTGEGISQYLYCFDQEWAPGMSGSAVNPLDPELNIDWPIKVDPTNLDLVSQKDFNAPSLRQVLQK